MRSIKLMKFLIFILTISFFAAGCSAGSDAEGCPAGSEGCPCAEDEYGYLALCDGPLTCEDGYCYDLGGDNDDDDVNDDCTPGEERCTCDDGDCESGLECVSNRCVDPQNPDGNDDDENNDGNDDDENPDDKDENDGNDDDEESDANDDDDEESDGNDDDEESDANDDDEESDADDDEESDANNDDEESDADDDEESDDNPDDTDESDDNPDDTDESDDNPDDTDESDDTTDESAGDTDESADESAGDTDESADDTDDNNQTDGECGGDGLVSDFEDDLSINDVIGSGLDDAEWDWFSNDSGDVSLEQDDGGSGTCGSGALHFEGSGISDGGWVGMEFFLKGEFNAPDDNVVEPADVSDYVGLQFKAKVGSGNQNAWRVNFNIPETQHEDNSGGACEPVEDDTCYNHLGRFLYPESDGDKIYNDKVILTEEWKTYTLCFDRDLHPQWLPSNLNASQREDLSEKLLSVQFLPNKSIDLGATAIDSEDPTLHEIGDQFDLWLDDVRFIKDESACMGSNSDYDFTPLNDPGDNCSMVEGAEKYSAILADLYMHWKNEFLQSGWVNMPEQTTDGSTSESQGYGLILSAAMGDSSAFDAIWGAIDSANDVGGGLMQWSKNQRDGTSATDGDEDIAYGLMMGDKVFGGYSSHASTMVSAIWGSDISTAEPRIKLGSNFDVGFNTSYHAPYYYRRYKDIDGGNDWIGVGNTGYSIVNSCSFGNGLFADWCDFSGNPKCAQGGSDCVGAQVCGEGMCDSVVFAYEAARVGWRVGVDACWDGNGDATGITQGLVDFFSGEYDGGNDIRLMEAGWTINGTPHSAAVLNQASFVGPIGIAAKSTNNDTMLKNAFIATLDMLHYPLLNRVYYSTSLGLMSLLEMTGNIPHVE